MCRILIVDDDNDSAESLALVCELWGHQALAAGTANEALAAAETFRPEIALLDLMMPGMDGYELARRLMAQPGLELLKLAAITGWAREEDRLRCLRQGFAERFVKPLDLRYLKEFLASPEREGTAAATEVSLEPGARRGKGLPVEVS